MDYDEKELDIIPDGEPDGEDGGDNIVNRVADEQAMRIAALEHELANAHLALDEAQRRLDMFAQLLAGKDAELVVAAHRIDELNAQLLAIAEDAQHWVDRAEFEDKLKLMEEYARAQYARRHHSRNFQPLAEWLAELEPVQ